MSDDQRALAAAAREAAPGAHAPYSRFRVGAAVLAGGEVFAGANIENASSNLGICAERVAIAHARMRGRTDIKGIAVACIDAPEGGPIETRMPCGACRQWLAELAPDAWVVVDGSDRVFRLDDLLPNPFRLEPS